MVDAHSGRVLSACSLPRLPQKIRPQHTQAEMPSSFTGAACTKDSMQALLHRGSLHKVITLSMTVSGGAATAVFCFF